MLKRNFVYNIRNAFNQNRFQYFFRDLAIIFIKRIKKSQYLSISQSRHYRQQISTLKIQLSTPFKNNF